MENNTVEEMKIFLKVLDKMAKHICRQMLKEEPSHTNNIPQQKQFESPTTEGNLELCSTKQAQMIYARTKNFPELRKQIILQYGRTDNIPKSDVKAICLRIDKAEGK